MRIDRRKATQSDIPFLLSLRRETMGIHLAASGAGCSEESHLARVLHSYDCAEILTVGSSPVGLLKVQREQGAWEIVQIQLSPHLQGSGVGRALLEEVLAGAAIAGVEVRLSVLKANPARNLYERIGFKIVGEDAHEYSMLHSRDGPSKPNPLRRSA